MTRCAIFVSVSASASWLMRVLHSYLSRTSLARPTRSVHPSYRNDPANGPFRTSSSPRGHMVTVQGMNGINSVLTSECPSSSSRRAEESTSIADETAENGRQLPRHASGKSVAPRRRHPSCWAAVAVALLVINAIVHLADAQPCPNSCNGHGRCSNPDRTCYCFTGYLGPDCSRLSCPYGAAWVDLAAGNDNAHNAAECSNMGLCDRSTGTCTCRTGFGGKVCPPCCP